MSEIHAAMAEGRATVSPLERLVAENGRQPGAVLAVLEGLQQQSEQKYLPLSVIRDAARALGIPLSQAYSVVTFYAFFNLRPQGRHTLAICRGTACHTRGSRNLLEAARAALAFPAQSPNDGEGDLGPRTTEDNRFTLRTVACFGQCALAPVAEVDHTIHGHINRQKLLGMIDRLREQGDRR